jgi:hypothetical protein
MVLVVFSAGLVWYGVVAAVWAAGTGEQGRPPTVLLLLASAAFTVALPAIRRAGERLANRFALGDRADSYELVMGFLHRMTNTLAVDDVLPRLAEAAARSAHSDRGEVRLLLADGRQQRQIWPPEAAVAADPTTGDLTTGDLTTTVAVRHRGAMIGQLGVETAHAVVPLDARRLLDDLAGPAGIALTSVRLTVELRRRLDEVERLTEALAASRTRLIEARRRERQRIHAQAERRLVPHLDDLARHLAAAERAARAVEEGHEVGPAPAGAEAELERALAAAAADAAAALDALRRLSRRVFSPVLLDSGIKAALRAWADQSGVALTIHERGELAALHDRPVVESALYLTCVTGLELMPAPTVEIDVDGDGASVTLPWPVGPGAPAEAEPLRQLLSDRAEALGGWAQVDPATATIRTWVPLETAVDSDPLVTP